MSILVNMEYREFVATLFQRSVGEVVAEPDSDEEVVMALVHAAMGLSGEAGEVTDEIKKVWVNGKGLDFAKLAKELGDLRFYYQAILNELGVTDKEICELNQLKLAERFPDGVYTRQDAIVQRDKHSAKT